MTCLPFTPCLVPFGVTIEFPSSSIELVEFRDLTPIGVQTDSLAPVAPGARHAIEVRFADGPTLAVVACALFCRPVPSGVEFWTFVVDWEFASRLCIDTTLLALLPAVTANMETC